MSDLDNDPEGTDDGEGDDFPRTGIDRLRIDDVVHQQFQERVLSFAPSSEDGMPAPVLQQGTDHAPPLALDTLVCLPDESEFVVRDSWGVIQSRHRPEDVERTPAGRWRLKSPSTYGNTIEVEPIRPKCVHFVRQITDFAGQAQEVMMERCCTARRDSGGEFLSLRDAQMIACELRAPIDEASMDRVRRYDERKIRLGAERRRLGEGFDLSKIDQDEDADLDGVVE